MSIEIILDNIHPDPNCFNSIEQLNLQVKFGEKIKRLPIGVRRVFEINQDLFEETITLTFFLYDNMICTGQGELCINMGQLVITTYMPFQINLGFYYEKQAVENACLLNMRIKKAGGYEPEEIKYDSTSERIELNGEVLQGEGDKAEDESTIDLKYVSPPPPPIPHNLLGVPLIFSHISELYVNDHPISMEFKNRCIQESINIQNMWEVNGIDESFKKFLGSKFPLTYDPNCINFLYFPSKLELLGSTKEGGCVLLGDTSKPLHFFQDPIQCLQLCHPLEMAVIRVLVYIPPNAPGCTPNFRQEEDGSVTIFRNDVMLPTHMFHLRYGELMDNSPEYSILRKEYKAAAQISGLIVEPIAISKLQSSRGFYLYLQHKYKHKYSPDSVKTAYVNANKSEVKKYSESLEVGDLIEGDTYKVSGCPEMDIGESMVNVRCLYYDYGHQKSPEEELKEDSMSCTYISKSNKELFCPTHWIKGRKTGGSMLPQSDPLYVTITKEFESAQSKHIDKLSIQGIGIIPGGEKGKEEIKSRFKESYDETYYTLYYSATTAQKVAKYYETGRRSQLMTGSAKGTFGKGYYYSKDPIDCSRFYSKDKIILRVEIYIHPDHKAQKDEEGRICLESLDGVIVTHSIRYKGQKNIHTYKLLKGKSEYNQVNSNFETAQVHGTSLKVLSIRGIKKKEGEQALDEYKKTCQGKMLSLYHGTKVALIDAITFQTDQTGFKMPTHAGMLGIGIYFAPDPAKSLQYCDADKLMFQCDVWIDETEGPKKAKYAQNKIYDEWCVYDTHAGNPKYIIKFA